MGHNKSTTDILAHYLKQSLDKESACYWDCVREIESACKDLAETLDRLELKQKEN